MSKVKKIRAKDFMLQLKHEDRFLKIGFGEYFYEQNQLISITEEFSELKLQKINNLQIDDEKKVAEFDCIFKDIQTHFILKEVYEGTLNIMKFIQSYNEKPFSIDFHKNKDEISIVIDKDGFNLSLDNVKSKKSISLFNTEKGSFLEINSPRPTGRFTVEACLINEKGLFIKHDGLDLYSREKINNLEYSWDFNIQPEMQKLMIDFMEIALNMGNVLGRG